MPMHNLMFIRKTQTALGVARHDPGQLFPLFVRNVRRLIDRGLKGFWSSLHRLMGSKIFKRLSAEVVGTLEMNYFMFGQVDPLGVGCRTVLLMQTKGDFVRFGGFYPGEVVKACCVLNEYGSQDSSLKLTRHNMYSSMRVFVIDRFDQLVDLDLNTVIEVDSENGADQVMEGYRARLQDGGVDPERVELIRSSLSEGMTDVLIATLNLRQISILSIEPHIYELVMPILKSVRDLLADGAVIVFSRWWHAPEEGGRTIRHAVDDWLADSDGLSLEFLHGGGHGSAAFVVRRRSSENPMAAVGELDVG